MTSETTEKAFVVCICCDRSIERYSICDVFIIQPILPELHAKALCAYCRNKPLGIIIAQACESVLRLRAAQWTAGPHDDREHAMILTHALLLAADDDPERYYGLSVVPTMCGQSVPTGQAIAVFGDRMPDSGTPCNECELQLARREVARWATPVPYPTCQSEDQGGHPGCARPATYRTIRVTTFRGASAQRMYFCNAHRERFFRLEDTQRIPPSDAMSEALEAHAVNLEDKLERYASDHFKEETKYRASLEQLGLTKTNWWKVVIDAAEEALADLPQLRRCAAMLVQVASECDIDGIDQDAFKQLLELERWARDNIEARSRALKEAPQ